MTMSITLDLPDDLLARLRDEAAARGAPVESVAVAHIAAAYAPPPVASIHDDDADAYAALIAEGDADRAGSLVREHIEHTGEAVSRLLALSES